MNEWKKIKNLFFSELRRGLKLLKVYPLDTANNLISFVVVSVVIILGIDKLGNPNQLFGIILFPLIMTLISGPSGSIRSDIEIGVFEQVYTSKYSLLTIGIVRSVVNALFSVINSVIIFIIVYIFFYKMHISIIDLLLISFITILMSLSLGTIMAGLTILFRKTETILNFLNILILIELMVPFTSMHITNVYICMLCIPFSGLIVFLQQSFSGVYIISNLTVLALTILNFIIIGVFAYWMYHKCLKKAKLEGTLGNY